MKLPQSIVLKDGDEGEDAGGGLRRTVVENKSGERRTLLFETEANSDGTHRRTVVGEETQVKAADGSVKTVRRMSTHAKGVGAPKKRDYHADAQGDAETRGCCQALFGRKKAAVAGEG